MVNPSPSVPNLQQQALSLPPCYVVPSNCSAYQSLFIWPARTMQVAWYNERIRDLVGRLPGLSYQSIAAKSGLDKFLQMSPGDRVAWAAVACRELAQDSPIHPLAIIFYADVDGGGPIYGSHEALASLGAENIRAYGSDQLVTHERDELVRVISQSISRLRQIAIDPVSVPLWGELDMEVRPDADDARVLIGRKGWGYTTVNYTHEGLIVDVIAEGDTGTLHTASMYSTDLMLPDENDGQEQLNETPAVEG